MEIGIASPNEKEKMQMMQYQAQPAPLAEQKPGFVEEFGNMAKKRAMEGALNKGEKFFTEGGAKPYMQGITNAINPMGSAGAGAVAGQAATNAALASTPATMGMAGAELGALASGAGGAAGMGGMAALGTAVPYVGAGLLAGKALGLFNEGGMVGPLSTQYHAEGYQVPGSEEYQRRMFRNRADRLREPVLDYLKDKNQSSRNFGEGLRQLRKQQDFVYPMIVSDYGAGLGITSPMQDGVARMAFTDDPIAKKMYDVGNAPPDTSASGLTSNYIGYPIDDEGYTARGFKQGGQVLINDNDEINKILDEIEAEEANQMVEGAMGTPMPMPMMRPPLTTAPLGNDTTYSDEMYKSINT